MKKVLIISTSPRKGGNSQALADAFMKGAKEANNQVEKVELYAKNINFCLGCLACQKSGQCVIKDDANAIVEKMRDADVLVFATPIYYYAMSGQMKTMLDRSNPLYESDYKFTDIYLLASAADEQDEAVEGAVKGLLGWISCFPRTHLAGVVFGGGVDEVGKIEGHPALDKAYELGKAI